jgi:hypothetical protein
VLCLQLLLLLLRLGLNAHTSNQLQQQCMRHRLQ